MKAVAIALIIVGGVLILAPVVAGYMNEEHRVRLLGVPGTTTVNLPPPLSREYTFGCWFTGTAMIAVSVYLAIRSERRTPTEANRGGPPPGIA